MPFRYVARRFASTLVLLLTLTALSASPTLAQGVYLGEGESGASAAGGLIWQEGGNAPAVQMGYSFGTGLRIDASIEYSSDGSIENLHHDSPEMRLEVLSAQVGAYVAQQTEDDPFWIQLSGFLGRSKFEDKSFGRTLGRVWQAGGILSVVRDLLPGRAVRLLMQAHVGQTFPFGAKGGDGDSHAIAAGDPFVTGGVGLGLRVPMSEKHGVYFIAEPSVAYNREVFSQSLAAGLIFRTSGGE